MARAAARPPRAGACLRPAVARRRPALPLPVRLALGALLALARPALPALPTTLPVLFALPARTLCAAPADVPALVRVLRFPDFTPLTPADPVPATAGVPLPINTAGWMPRGLPDTEALAAPVRVTTLTPFPPLACTRIVAAQSAGASFQLRRRVFCSHGAPHSGSISRIYFRAIVLSYGQLLPGAIQMYLHHSSISAKCRIPVRQ
ncbi:hypothetical protein J2Z28_002995 [Paenibacillus xylanexedens]|uniref:Uncharacterized protein n=1 Tax=Paenibacillus xylanexedens TaxID=528191 RepID=A0ABS4RUE5_PAEXY|nr:hypothetical protein [Paenibacillus xylanexedens]